MARSKSTTAPAPKTEASAPASTETTPTEDEVVTLQGRLTADPVLRRTQTGKSVSTIRIAVDHPDGKATFHNVVVWNRTAEAVCQYKKKGHLVEVQGRAQERTYKPQDGPARTVTEISAFRVQFLSALGTAPVAEKELS